MDYGLWIMDHINIICFVRRCAFAVRVKIKNTDKYVPLRSGKRSFACSPVVSGGKFEVFNA